VFLQSLGVLKLPSPLNGVGVAQQVGVDPLFNACLLESVVKLEENC
jgi:hypothetical protein